MVLNDLNLLFVSFVEMEYFLPFDMITAPERRLSEHIPSDISLSLSLSLSVSLSLSLSLSLARSLARSLALPPPLLSIRLTAVSSKRFTVTRKENYGKEQHVYRCSFSMLENSCRNSFYSFVCFAFVLVSIAIN